MVKAWITDGSPVIFDETMKMETEIETSFIEELFSRTYEGIVDEVVQTGEISVPFQKGGHDAELEWALIFEDPLPEIEITPETECRLQGMIEGKNLGKLLGPNRISWLPSSLGNNVLAMTDNNTNPFVSGIKVKLKDLMARDIIAQMHLTFTPQNDDLPVVARHIPSTLLRNFPLIEFLRELSSKAELFNLNDVQIINLSAIGEESGYVNEGFRKAEALLESLFDGIISLRRIRRNTGLTNSDISDRIRDKLVRNVIEEKAYIKQGTSAFLFVSDSNNQEIGKARFESK